MTWRRGKDSARRPDLVGPSSTGPPTQRIELQDIPPLLGSIDNVETVNVDAIPDIRGRISIDERREIVRQSLAKLLIWILVGTLTGGFFSVVVLELIAAEKSIKIDIELIRSIFEMIFTAIVAIVGSVVGFYFGSAKNGNTDTQLDQSERPNEG